MTTAGMAPLRLLLWADPGELAAFSPDAVLADARARLRELPNGVELTHVEVISPDAVGVVFLAGVTVSVEDIDRVAAVLRTVLGIGPGRNQLISGVVEGIRGGIGREVLRGIGGEDSECPACGIAGGRHLRGCPLSGAR